MRDGRTPCSNSYPLFEGFDATTGPGQEFVAPSRGPLLAQTSRNPLWQPCGIVALRPPQNRMDKGVSRGASSRVVVPLPTRRAGGRWFEPSTAHLTKAPAHAGFASKRDRQRRRCRLEGQETSVETERWSVPLLIPPRSSRPAGYRSTAPAAEAPSPLPSSPLRGRSRRRLGDSLLVLRKSAALSGTLG
jgi:hypothetical protein